LTGVREKGVLVYPVYSRRSGGLSVGINLFPARKRCSFNCPYCEVFPFSTGSVFDVEQMEEDLRETLAAALEKNEPVKDICFSGNGEPTLSEDFPKALEMAGRVRGELVPASNLVLITCGSGLLDDGLFSLLREAATGSLALDIWLKLDAGTPEWYGKMNRSGLPFEKIIEKIKEFVLCAPVTSQTMICAIDGKGPPSEEERSWEDLLVELAMTKRKDSESQPLGLRATGSSGGIRKVQIYGKARPSPEDPMAEALPVEYLEARAASLRRAFDSVSSPALTDTGNTSPPVQVYP